MTGKNFEHKVAVPSVLLKQEKNIACELKTGSGSERADRCKENCSL